MGYQFLNVIVFTLFGIGFVIFTVAVLSRLLRPKVEDPAEPAKTETYECGEPAVGSSWVRFDIRFYTVALVFLIFDVEVTFLYPWALIFKEGREAGVGGFLFSEVFLFLIILGAGFVYCWCRGDLDWLRTAARKEFPSRHLPGKAPAAEASVSESKPAAAAAE